jgi:ribokinase
MTVILDPAPARFLPREILRSVDILTPNESEALLLLERGETALPLAAASPVARALRALRVGAVILKLGAHGVILSGGTGERHFAAPRVQAVDTTAAGDTFNGALAVALAEAWALEEAIRFANIAAALSVTRFGAQASIPTRAEVDAALVSWGPAS